MSVTIAPSSLQVRDIELLVQSRHALLHIETTDEDQIETLLAHVAERLRMTLYTWLPHIGLKSYLSDGVIVPDTLDPLKCLAYIDDHKLATIFLLRGFHRHVDDPVAVGRLKQIRRHFASRSGGVVITTPPHAGLPLDVEPLVTEVELRPPSRQEYYDFVRAVLADVAERRPVRIDLGENDVDELLQHMKGLAFFEVQKIVTQAVVEDGVFDREDLGKVLEAKQRIIRRSGVLDYFPRDHSMADVAGLDTLKEWLRKRSAAFADPTAARAFGLTPPKGLLLLGVQGCGKSLFAKAVAAEWRLPLIRLDPSNLYQKYYGESEKNFIRATRTAERMAPIVLWIDEIEKAFGQDQNDGGTTGRVFATFLSWLQEKRESVFVLATANDISKLPAELVRKGRFDEIFFLDLPNPQTRAEIFRVHLERRGRSVADFDLEELAQSTEGFSGAEIEQAVVAALYTAFGTKTPLDMPTLQAELALTRPLSVTMEEKVTSLRAWARHRAVPAE